MPPIEWPARTTSDVQDLQKGDQIVAQVQPVPTTLGSVSPGLCVRDRAVERQDASVVAKRLEDRSIGEGVEAVGVEEDQVDGTAGSPKSSKAIA